VDHTLQNEDDPYQDDQYKDCEYINESNEYFQADTDEQESKSDDNTDMSAIPEVPPKTQAPVVLTQENNHNHKYWLKHKKIQFVMSQT